MVFLELKANLCTNVHVVKGDVLFILLGDDDIGISARIALFRLFHSLPQFS
jgi:hypothetical protein